MKIRQYFERIILKLKYHHLLDWLPDSLYLRLMYRIILHKKLNLQNPQTFNEKLQWLKLYDRNPIYTSMVDKYEAKKYVAKIIGENYINPTIGIWNSFDEIDFDTLPNQFVLKCTHNSGGLFICRNKNSFDINVARQKIEKSLQRNYFYNGREWPYKNVKPRIIAEKYLEDESGYELKDYKVFCFYGIPKLIQVDYDRFTDHKRNIYTCNWHYLNCQLLYPTHSEIEINKPQKLDELLELSERLSNRIPFLRTDFYIINDKIYFGELTLYPGSGFEKFTPEIWDIKIGNLIDLSKHKINL